MKTGSNIEPLARLARFSWDWAPALCDPSHGCADYHRSWSIVRLLELHGAPPGGADFFQAELAAIARKHDARVLISGGADTGFPALIAGAFRALGSTPQLHFIDRCLTPCWQNRLFARENGLNMQVEASDVAEIDCAPVDAVVAHSFLHLLPGAKRQEALDAWARVLKPGGIVLTTSAMAEHEDDWVRQKDLAKIEQRRQALVLSAIDAGFPADTAAEIAETASRFWRSSPSQRPALTEANLRAGLAKAGLELVRLNRLEVDAVPRGPVSMATIETTRRFRAQIVAARP